MFQNYFQECKFVIFTGSAPLAPLQLQVWLRPEWINVAVTAPVRIPRAWMNGGNQLQLQVLICGFKQPLQLQNPALLN